MANRNGRPSKERQREQGGASNVDRGHSETRRYSAGQGEDGRNRTPDEDRYRADRGGAPIYGEGDHEAKVWREGQEWRDEWRPRERPAQSYFAGDRGGYRPYDARNYDSGGFGYGGTSGSGGGFGAGGAGPQSGGYGTQANYGQGYPAGDYDPQHRDDYHPDERRRPSWLDSFPHSFSGWGPRTPTYENDPQRALGYTPQSARPPSQDYGMNHHRNYAKEHPDDVHYRAWREQQIRELDADYDAWRAENRTRFDEDFGGWRENRRKQKPDRVTGAAGDAARKRDVSDTDR